MSRSRESHRKLEHPTDNWRHSVGPVPAGENAPLPTLALGEAGALEHVDSGRVLSDAVVATRLEGMGLHTG